MLRRRAPGARNGKFYASGGAADVEVTQRPAWPAYFTGEHWAVGIHAQASTAFGVVEME